MFDDLQDLFGHSNAFGPNAARKPAKAVSNSPFDRLHPEDRKALASPETLRSPLVRRWLKFPDPAPETLNARQANPPGATAAGDPDRYEVLAGWQVPGDWDLKDLGRAALDNATKAGSLDGDRPAAPPLAAAAGVDAHGPDGGRSAAGQVRAAKTIRARAANARPEPLKKPAAAKASHTGLQSPAASGRNPALGPQRSEKGPAPGDIENSVTGPAADLPAALWREIGSRLLDARHRPTGSRPTTPALSSIDLEQQARRRCEAAHDAGVIATAQSADPKLPGNTERATVNSALLAGTKYRQNRAARAKENETAAPLAAYRNRYLTFEREAAHARDKALRARFAGDDLAARRYERDAEGYRNAAEATLDDARNAGIDPQQVKAEAGPAGGQDADGQPSARSVDPAGTAAEFKQKNTLSNADRAVARAFARRDALRAESLKAAEARKHAGLGDIEHEADRREQERRQRAADTAFRTGANPESSSMQTMLHGIDVAIEYGAISRNYRPWLERVFDARTRAGSHLHLAILDRLTVLRRERRAVFDTLSPRLRTAVAVHRHIVATQGEIDGRDESAANREAIRRRASLVRSAVHDLHKRDGLKTLGFVADWLPVIGELKSGGEALIALRNYIAARERGDSKAAQEYREEAAWGLVGLVPLLGYSRKGRKLLRQLAAPVAKLSVKAGDAFARKIEEAVARHTRKRGNEAEPEDLRDNFEPAPKREFSERWAARRKVAILRHYGKNPKQENLKLDNLFPNGMAGLSKEQRAAANIAVARAKGGAGQSKVNRLLRDGGFVTATKGSGRTVTLEKRQRRYDIATTDKFRSFLGLFVFPGTHKGTIGNNRTVQIEIKSGDAGKTFRQGEIDEKVKKAAQRGNPMEVANRKDGLVIVGVEDMQLPTHWIDKEEFAAKLEKSLIGEFGRKRTDAFLKDLDDFYRNSTDENPIPIGVVLLYLAGSLHRLDGEDERNRP